MRPTGLSIFEHLVVTIWAVHPRTRAAPPLVAMGLVLLWGEGGVLSLGDGDGHAWPVHELLLHNDTFHYWTPFLDPSASSWGVVR